MSSIWPIIVVAVLALACPLCMVVMGALAWAVARARGGKKEISETGSKP